MLAGTPCYEPDIFSVDGVVNPYPHYAALRALGSAVFLPLHSVWAIPRYAGVKLVLDDPETFISSKGIAISREMNEMLVGSIITSDGPAHARLRALEAPPLMPPSLERLREHVRAEARALVRRLRERQTFDCVTDLAQYLPVTIVADLVGLPATGRENMLEWSASIFQLVGPLNELSETALSNCVEMFDFTQSVAATDVRPGSWAARIFDLCEQGTVTHAEAGRMLVDLIGPALDSTIFGISNLIFLLGENPDQYSKLRANPALVGNAVNEALRLESPIRGFTRYSRRDVDFEGVMVPANSRLLVLYASANRDERMWGRDAARFDVERPHAAKHLAFGYGKHSCLGMHLARLEMTAILEAMTEQVESLRIEVPERELITSLRGIRRMRTEFEPSPA